MESDMKDKNGGNLTGEANILKRNLQTRGA